MKSLDTYIKSKFPRLGINKKREIKRLLFEIAKRDDIEPENILNNEKLKDFSSIKSFLLKKRYPKTFELYPKSSFYLPSLNIQNELALKRDYGKFEPKSVYVEEKALKSSLAEKTRKLFPSAEFKTIKAMKDFNKKHNYTLKDYSNRRKNLFILHENYDFLKKCPCTKSAARCGYYVLNLGFGCPFECSYCFLQEYQNFSGISLTSNLTDFFKPLETKLKSFKGVLRIGSGEFSDSLALDGISGYSSEIINFFSNYPNAYFEFKTKSKEIKNLLNAKPAKNIVIAWSVNPQNIIDSDEFYSANLSQRIQSAKECSDAGYGIGFHFDPIIYYDGWKKDYKQTIEFIFSKISTDKIYWISLGTLRFNPELKKIIENRFPHSKTLNEELIMDFDGKMRYPDYLRTDIYLEMTKLLEHCGLKKEKIYLCMESSDIWNKTGLKLNRQWNR